MIFALRNEPPETRRRLPRVAVSCVPLSRGKQPGGRSWQLNLRAPRWESESEWHDPVHPSEADRTPG